MAVGSETTLLIIKPGSTSQAGHVTAFQEVLATQNFVTIASWEGVLPLVLAHSLFAEYEGTPKFEALVTSVLDGPVLALALSRADAIAGLGKLVSKLNAVVAYCSPSPEAAKRELRLFFPKTFPREYTVALICSRSEPGASSSSAAASSGAVVSKALAQLLKVASSFEFLVVKTAHLQSLPLSKAQEYCAHYPELSTAAAQDLASGGEVAAVLLEKAFAIDDLQHLLFNSPHAVFDAHVRVLTSRSTGTAISEVKLLFGTDALTPSLTFALVTPEALSRAEEVVASAEASGFTVVDSRLLTLSSEQALSLSGATATQEGLLTSGPSLALALQRPSAMSAFASLLGKSDEPVEAPSEGSTPTTLRALVGDDAVIAPITDVGADAELERFFPELLTEQTTLALLLPDAAPYIEEIIEKAKAIGLSVSMDTALQLGKDQAGEYLKKQGVAKVSDGLFSPRANPASVAHVASGESRVLTLTGKGAVAQWKALLGPLDPHIAKVRCPSSLRARFGADTTHCVGFGSPDAASAAAESRILFPNGGNVLPPVKMTEAQKKEYASKSINPLLTKGLIALCKAKPAKPVEWLAHWLLTNKPMDA